MPLNCSLGVFTTIPYAHADLTCEGLLRPPARRFIPIDIVGGNVWIQADNTTSYSTPDSFRSLSLMTKIDQYFSDIQRDLESRFARMRSQNTGSSAKGVASERIVGELIKPYLEPTRVAYRRQIIDSDDRASGEVDVIFCNLGQPSIETELLLAEGVDYAVQVKSVLTDEELSRFVENAASVKKLNRR